MEKKIITVWERLNSKSKEWEHNHISDGYDEALEKPIPKGNVQEKSWPNGEWRKFKAHMLGNTVVMDKKG